MQAGVFEQKVGGLDAYRGEKKESHLLACGYCLLESYDTTLPYS